MEFYKHCMEFYKLPQGGNLFSAFLHVSEIIWSATDPHRWQYLPNSSSNTYNWLVAGGISRCCFSMYCRSIFTVSLWDFPWFYGLFNNIKDEVVRWWGWGCCLLLSKVVQLCTQGIHLSSQKCTHRHSSWRSSCLAKWDTPWCFQRWSDV